MVGRTPPSVAGPLAGLCAPCKSAAGRGRPARTGGSAPPMPRYFRSFQRHTANTTMKSVPKHLLLFAATTGYQIRVFADAARRLGVEVTLATDRCHILDDPWGDRAIAVKFDQIEESLKALRGLRVDGVAAVGDRPAGLAAAAAEVLGGAFHPLAAARACHDKYRARQLFQAAGMRVPAFFRASLTDDPAALAERAPYPCVLKPLGLAGSRGVIRANDAREFVA